MCNEVIEAARSLSLTDFLESSLKLKGARSGAISRYEGCPNRKCGSNYEHGSRYLTVNRDDKTWFCSHCGESGDIIKAAELHWDELTPAAANMLVLSNLKKCQFKTHEEAEQEASEQAAALREALIKILSITKEYNDDPACLDYLTIERGIPEGLVREAQKRNMLGFLPSNKNVCKQIIINAIGEDLLKKSGLWGEISKVPAIMFRPIVFFMPGLHSAEFRIIGDAKEGESKSIRYGISPWPYVWRGQQSIRGVIVEGFIDMLSLIALGYTGHIIALTGVNNWKPEWFISLRKILGIEHWVIALDQDDDENASYTSEEEVRKNNPGADDEEVQEIMLKELRKKNPGQYAAKMIKETLAKQQQECIQRIPPSNSDINNILLKKLAA